MFYEAIGSRLSLPQRDRTVWDRMQALGLEFLGPQAPHGRPAESEPDDVPSDTKNVPTFYRPGTKPATAVNQLDYAFASRGFHEQVSVRAMNEIEEWGPSDHCRLMIEVKAKESRAARFFQPQRMQKEKKFLEPSSGIVVRKGAPEEKARILEAQKVGEAAKHVVPVVDDEPS